MIDASTRLWPPPQLKRAALWLAFLAPFFYVSYGCANWLASQRPDVGSILFAWERQIPFLAWTIIPYWSINLFYGLSLFVTKSREEVDRLGRRLLTAQIIAVFCFIAFPLRVAFGRPDTSGLTGFLFDALTAFDRPFNQAPSLHIALLVILWVHYLRHAPRRWQWLLHGGGTLIGLSVLTTYQHHFIDVPTGALLGWFAVWLWPEAAPNPLGVSKPTSDGRRLRLALRYLLGATAFGALAFLVGGWALWLLWPAVSLGLVACIYLAIGPAGFQKGDDGRLSAAVQVLLAPYLAGAWINSRLWTRGKAPSHEVMDGVAVGRLPDAQDASGFAGIVDLCAELTCSVRGVVYRSLPTLDLVPVPVDMLRRAGGEIERLRQGGKVLVTCALGLSRSATAVAAWLLLTGRARTAADAVALVRAAQPDVVLNAADLGAFDPR